MSARLANPFQFLDVDRKDPDKKHMDTRTEAFVEITIPSHRPRPLSSLIGVWNAKPLLRVEVSQHNFIPTG